MFTVICCMFGGIGFILEFSILFIVTFWCTL